MNFMMIMPPRSATGHENFYLWVALKWLHETENDPTSIILSEPYLNISLNNSRWELVPELAAKHGFMPRQIVRSELTHIYPTHFISACDGVPAEVLFKQDITLVDEALVAWYLGVIASERARRAGELTLVAWLNNASMREAARRARVPLIFNELGPLRAPYYQSTIYFDCSGVNGETEVSTRWKTECQAFKLWAFETFGEVPTPRKMRELIATPFSLNAFNDASHEGGIGLALQVETDSNAIAYNKGWSNRALIGYANGSSPEGPFIHRHHPAGQMIYPGKIDQSLSPIHFLKRVREIWTVNSSLGIEAALWGRKLRFFGESPFNTWENLPNEERDVFLAWFLLCYLVPAELLFNRQYYTWRIKSPNVADLAMRHLNLYRESLNRATLPAPKVATETSDELIYIEAPMTHLAQVRQQETENRALRSRQSVMYADIEELLQYQAKILADIAQLKVEHQALELRLHLTSRQRRRYKFLTISCATFLLAALALLMAGLLQE